MSKPRILRRIEKDPVVTYYKPKGIPLRQLMEISLPVEGLEAMRLADALELDQEASAKRMGISKPTFCRVLSEARKAVATALYNGHALSITGGSYYIDGEENVLPLDPGNLAKPSECPQDCTCPGRRGEMRAIGEEVT